LQTDVLIVGAGPTGLSAGLFLVERGFAVRIVEQQDRLSQHSKAFGVNPRTLSLLESTGVTERLLAQGHRMVAANLWRHGRRVFQVDLTKAGHRFPFMLIHSQANSEAALADALTQRGIATEFQTRLTDIESDRDGVTARLESSDGRVERVDCRFALGADGPRSTVREQLGIGFPVQAVPEPWTIIDLSLDTGLAGDQAHLILHDEGVVFVIRLEQNLWRVAGNMRPLLDFLPAGTFAGEVLWESDFTIRHGMADRLCVGSVALAGDAAHLHAPLGARGMNLGVEDAFVFARLLSEARLGEYDAVRRPAVQSVVRRVERMTQIARGRLVYARLVRWFLPLLGPLCELAAGNLRKWVLGLDHDVEHPGESVLNSRS
jgi:2-polyprenyl-6-methoxyphenol hydroxylase-like FAD-dependent oxidoreductase